VSWRCLVRISAGITTVSVLSKPGMQLRKPWCLNVNLSTFLHSTVMKHLTFAHVLAILRSEMGLTSKFAADNENHLIWVPYSRIQTQFCSASAYEYDVIGALSHYHVPTIAPSVKRLSKNWTTVILYGQSM
jgi:hypothetical protein